MSTRFDSAKLIDLAESLLNETAFTADRQAVVRTVLNRAYYSPFIELLQRIGSVCGASAIPPARTHRWVRRGLSAGNKHLKKVRNGFDGLERGRVAADYHPNEVIDENRAAEAITRARKLMYLIRHDIPDEKLKPFATLNPR